MTDNGSFYYNSSEFEIDDMQQSMLLIFDHLLQRIGEYIRFSEELELELDSKDEDQEDALLQQQRDESVRLSGTRIKQLEEIRTVRKVFADTAPGSVPDEILLNTSNMFKELALATLIELHAPYPVLRPEEKKSLERDLKAYALALLTLGHSSVPMLISAVYPFNDLDVILFPNNES